MNTTTLISVLSSTFAIAASLLVSATALAALDGLRALDVPTLVVHGSADTLIGPGGGRRTAELIPGARFELIDGMGHDYPPQLWQPLTRLFADHALGRR